MTTIQGELQVTSQLMLLDQGLHLIRIAEVQVSGVTILGLNSTPVGHGKIEFFPAENVTDLTLRQAGDCIVARVSGDKAGLLVTEYKVGNGGGEIKLRIDRVATHFPPQAAASSQTSPAPQGFTPAQAFTPPQVSPFSQASAAASVATSPVSVKILGHICGRGDMIASDGWIGDPNGTAGLEGFAIKAIGLPQDVALTYSCRSSGAKQIQNAQDGGFIGSRGKSHKINSIKLELVGAGAGNFTLSGGAQFLSGARLDIMNGVMLHGKDNLDSLVAFVVSVSPESSAQQSEKKEADQAVSAPVKRAVKKPSSASVSARNSKIKRKS